MVPWPVQNSPLSHVASTLRVRRKNSNAPAPLFDPQVYIPGDAFLYRKRGEENRKSATYAKAPAAREIGNGNWQPALKLRQPGKAFRCTVSMSGNYFLGRRLAVRFPRGTIYGPWTMDRGPWTLARGPWPVQNSPLSHVASTLRVRRKNSNAPAPLFDPQVYTPGAAFLSGKRGEENRKSATYSKAPAARKTVPLHGFNVWELLFGANTGSQVSPRHNPWTLDLGPCPVVLKHDVSSQDEIPARSR